MGRDRIGHGLDQIRVRAIAALKEYENPDPPWTGPVIRVASRNESADIQIVRCPNQYCREWTPRRLRRCTSCDTPLATPTASTVVEPNGRRS